jgi:uncharacterized membrane protein (UPF0127 family)
MRVVRSLLRRAVLLLLPAMTALLLASCGGDDGNGLDHVTVSVAGVAVDAEVARTPDERGLGLGLRDALDHGAGMLFVYEEEGQHSFWMRGMRFPLDFIWIDAQRTVVDLTLDVPAPAAGTADADLESIVPIAPVRYVLEVNAGVVREGSVSIGDAVSFNPEP